MLDSWLFSVIEYYDFQNMKIILQNSKYILRIGETENEKWLDLDRIWFLKVKRDDESQS